MRRRRRPVTETDRRSHGDRISALKRLSGRDPQKDMDMDMLKRSAANKSATGARGYDATLVRWLPRLAHRAGLVYAVLGILACETNSRPETDRQVKCDSGW